MVPTAAREGERLCATLVAELGVSGASISVVSNGGRQSTVGSSDRTVARVEALQFERGEGPHWDALASRSPVLAPDIGSRSEVRWPAFRAGIGGLGVHGLFAFPMMMGGALVGVVDLYDTAWRPVDALFVSRASIAAGWAAPASVRAAVRSAEEHAAPESPLAPALRREVHQATGVLEAQLGVSAVDAFALLRGHAFVTGRPLDGVAHDVVIGMLIL